MDHFCKVNRVDLTWILLPPGAIVQNTEFISIAPARIFALGIAAIATDGLHADGICFDLLVFYCDVNSSRGSRNKNLTAPWVDLRIWRIVASPAYTFAPKIELARTGDHYLVAIGPEDETGLHAHSPRFVLARFGARDRADLGPTDDAPTVQKSIVSSQLIAKIRLL
jgi:hypothetical protein